MSKENAENAKDKGKSPAGENEGRKKDKENSLGKKSKTGKGSRENIRGTGGRQGKENSGIMPGGGERKENRTDTDSKKNKRLIVREVRGSYEAICTFLEEHAGFKIKNLLEQDEVPIQSRKAWLQQGMGAMRAANADRDTLRQQGADDLIAIGNYANVGLLIMNKFHIIHPKRLWWWGFFIHGKKEQKILKIALKLFLSPNVRFIIFSAYEKDLYPKVLGIPKSQLVSLPYGDWKNQAGKSTAESTAPEKSKEAAGEEKTGQKEEKIRQREGQKAEDKEKTEGQESGKEEPGREESLEKEPKGAGSRKEETKEAGSLKKEPEKEEGRKEESSKERSKKEENRKEVTKAPGYYFAGGYSNRDYRMLIKTWEEMTDKAAERGRERGRERYLIIIGSANNADLGEYLAKDRDPSKHGGNIAILLDQPQEVFDKYLKGANAVILPFISNTGASGQTVALKCMMYNRLLIASDTDAMREYVHAGRTGFLLKDFSKNLEGTLQMIEDNPEEVKEMIASQRDLFDEKFSYPVVTGKLLELFGHK